MITSRHGATGIFADNAAAVLWLFFESSFVQSDTR